MTGLDQHQVRTWTSWHRWSILVMLAHAFLAVQTATQRDIEHRNPSLIRLSINEFRRLFVALILTRCTTETAYSTGPSGADDTNNEPTNATKTADCNLNEPELRL